MSRTPTRYNTCIKGEKTNIHMAPKTLVLCAYIQGTYNFHWYLSQTNRDILACRIRPQLLTQGLNGLLKHNFLQF